MEKFTIGLDFTVPANTPEEVWQIAHEMRRLVNFHMGHLGVKIGHMFVEFDLPSPPKEVTP